MDTSITVTVRGNGLTYCTSSVGGKKATCTAGPKQAAEALAIKLGPEISVLSFKELAGGIYEATLGVEPPCTSIADS